MGHAAKKHPAATRCFLAEKFSDFNTVTKGLVIFYDGAYSSPVGPLSGTTYAIDNGQRHVGNEVDLTFNYDVTENVKAEFVGAYFNSGKLLASINDNNAYSLRSGVKVSF